MTNLTLCFRFHDSRIAPGTINYAGHTEPHAFARLSALRLAKHVDRFAYLLAHPDFQPRYPGGGFACIRVERPSGPTEVLHLHLASMRGDLWVWVPAFPAGQPHVTLLAPPDLQPPRFAGASAGAL